jgi:hypothetical protein
MEENSLDVEELHQPLSITVEVGKDHTTKLLG